MLNSGALVGPHTVMLRLTAHMGPRVAICRLLAPSWRAAVLATRRGRRCGDEQSGGHGPGQSGRCGIVARPKEARLPRR
jgi:hypothetical protein